MCHAGHPGKVKQVFRILFSLKHYKQRPTTLCCELKYAAVPTPRIDYSAV